jgi:hypothetical protein
MRFGSEFAAGGTHRRLALVGVTLAAILTMCVGAGALRPADAHATALKDNCTMLVTNKTGTQGNVRPILYTPLLPTSPASLALYVARAATGIQTQGFDAFTNYGVIVPSWGCRAFMNFTSPSGTVSCRVEAPSRGANTFSCDGPAETKVIRDDDDIAGEIGIPRRTGAPGPKSTDQPDVSGGSVSLGALPGSGWQKSMDISDFGIVGKLMATEEEAPGCGKSGDEATPSDVNTEEAVRAGGDEGVGAVVTTYDNADQAKDFLKEMTSGHGIDCMAKLLNSKDTQVAVQPLPSPEGNDGDIEKSDVDGSQLVISRRGDDGDWRPVSYFNVSGWTDGNEAAIEWYETVGGAPSEAAEAEATDAVRIGN